MPKRLQGRIAPAQMGVGTHGSTMSQLLQWIVNQQALGGSQGLGVLGVGFVHANHLSQHIQKTAVQLIPFDDNPLIVKAFQKITAIKGNGRF
jgi:hypothetical protein